MKKTKYRTAENRIKDMITNAPAASFAALTSFYLEHLVLCGEGANSKAGRESIKFMRLKISPIYVEFQSVKCSLAQKSPPPFLIEIKLDFSLSTIYIFICYPLTADIGSLSVECTALK